MPSITVFQQTIGAFLKHIPKKEEKKREKNPPEELLKTVTDPDPGPAVIFSEQQNEKGMKVSVSRIHSVHQC